MEAVTVWDTTATEGGRVLAFDLVDILALVSDELPDTEWRITVEEAMGEALFEWDHITRTNEVISGRQLLELARRTAQTIDADFRGTKSGSPWLRIRAIDSTEFAIISPKKSIIAKIKERFIDVRDSPHDAKWYGGWSNP